MKNTSRSNLIVSTLLLFAAKSLCAAEQGSHLQHEVAERVKPFLQEISKALVAQDPAAVRSAATKATSALGPWAGKPETDTRYYPPVVTTPFDGAALRDTWLKELERGQRNFPWTKNPDGNPRVMTAGLREAAFPLDALARSVTFFPEHRAKILQQVREGANWLLKLQHASGVFPFPVGPGLKPRGKVGTIAAQMIKDHPEILENDWIVHSLKDGGLQFDNGLCGRALLSAWDLTQDDRYLAAARKAGDWAMKQPLVLNWNYNAFSVGLLARLARATGDSTYLDAALKKAETGVLPGQMAGGRWFDPHNACAVYHNILLRDLLELAHALPPGHPYQPTLLDALTRGLNQAADETLKNGYTGTWTDNFAQGLQWLGENKKWREALNVNINASGKGGAPSLGVAAVAVLEGLPPRALR